MNSIPVSDKLKVVDRLSEGQSYSQAMISTSIKSKDTVHRIAKTEANAIERKRAQYLKKIKQFGGSDSRRAKLWANMMQALKTSTSGKVVPDWQARAVALKYIDTLAGLFQVEAAQVEVNNFVPPYPTDIHPDDIQDWNAKFKAFLMEQ